MGLLDSISDVFGFTKTPDPIVQCNVYRVSTDPDNDYSINGLPKPMVSSQISGKKIREDVIDKLQDIKEDAKSYEAGKSAYVKGECGNGVCMDYFIMCDNLGRPSSPRRRLSTRFISSGYSDYRSITCFRGKTKEAESKTYYKKVPFFSKSWMSYKAACSHQDHRHTCPPSRDMGTFYQVVKDEFGKANWYKAINIAKIFDPDFEVKDLLLSYGITKESNQHLIFVQALASRLLLAIRDRYRRNPSMITHKINQLYAIIKSERLSDTDKRRIISIFADGLKTAIYIRNVEKPDRTICVGR